MRRSLSRGAPLVALALIAPLLLSAPGRGSDPEQGAATPAQQGPACEVGPDAGAVARREIARLAAQPGNSDVVVLNGRGYNYGATAEERIERIRLQALDAQVDLPAPASAK